MPFFAVHLFGLPVGNPAAPKLIEEGFFIPCDFWGSVRIGYEGDFVSDAKMEQFHSSDGRVDSYQQETNSGIISFNILNRVDLFGVLGSSRTSTDWRFVDAANAVHRIELETNYDFLWGVGIRGILYQWECLCLGAGGRYESARYDPSWITSNGVPEPTSNSLLSWREWQIDLDAGYKIDIFTPYIGIKYSNARTMISGLTEVISQHNQFTNRIPIGVFIGCSLSSSKYFMLNVEGRLVDEEAVTVSGDIRF